MSARVEELSAHPADAAELLTSRIVTVPRESATMPSFSNDFKVRKRPLWHCRGSARSVRAWWRAPGTGADAFILEISGKALVKPRKEKLAHRPHDFGKMLRCFPVNVVFNVNILIQQSAERAGRSDENFRLLLGLNQNIKADFLHRTGGRQRADFAGTGGKQGNFRCSPDWIKMRSLPERTSRTPRQSSSQL